MNVVPITTRGIGHEAWIAVRHQDPLGVDTSWTRVAPQVIRNGIFLIRPEFTTFLRGDSDGDELVQISDPVGTLNFLFRGDRRPHCFDAADANDDGKLDINDPIRTLYFLFRGNYPLPAPSPGPGEDPTPDGLGCLYRSS